ncbi:HMG (high mobility group) box protein with ARID/BRIGHT DNA-binding domain-containing protein [Actinidia rufa]|uniref:HMG (High mobility group) box protein with ARID/BRIGHT DNA-binding domain-containing protein n=1 Tax=Actinidia rufa TaxID=165716 RepID=A0A7J0GI97_9ERIC|nr:HMG (high mobility group) box protein with ARID/BRIGHT DNA-binding domain-containing protein [Actinidia rufa]
MSSLRYPPPLASHDDVVKDPTLFWDTLRNFHTALGTKYMVPVIGGKDLNLHVLYVEVTQRGGFDKVVSEKKWREISSVFSFSPTTTSASYALRKHYFSLLHQYEQLYFFKRQGPWMASTASGTIDGKFDCGYLVSVKVGSEILKGVLYYPNLPDPSISTNQACTAIVPYTPIPFSLPGKREGVHENDRGVLEQFKPRREDASEVITEARQLLVENYFQTPSSALVQPWPLRISGRAPLTGSALQPKRHYNGVIRSNAFADQDRSLCYFLLKVF